MNTRDRILEDLSQLYAQDRISVDDYERRVGAVMAAKNDEEAKLVNLDLLSPGKYDSPATRGPEGVATMTGRSLGMGDPIEGGSKDVVAIFSGTTLKGWFEVPPHIDVAAIFGGAEVDLREAQIPADGVTIEVAAIFGGVEIKLPEHVGVMVEGIPIFGGIEHPSHNGSRTGPLVRIKATAIFGGVEIKFPRN